LGIFEVLFFFFLNICWFEDIEAFCSRGDQCAWDLTVPTNLLHTGLPLMNKQKLRRDLDVFQQLLVLGFFFLVFF
jgi:hypothetical protein